MNRFLLYAFSVAMAVTALPVYSITATEETEAPTIIVSATRSEQNSITTPASISVISRQQIEASGAEHIVDVLRGQAGVQINDLYGDGSRASIDMRGFGSAASSNVLILVDGRRLNNSDISSPDLNSVSLKDVQRIEIVQGSAGVLFGDQAVGGVVNIITTGSRGEVGTIEATAGSYDTVGLRVVYGDNVTDKVHYRVSAEQRESDNYRRDNNEIQYTNLFAKTGYDYSAGEIFAEAQYIKEDLGLPGSLTEAEMDDDRRLPVRLPER